MFEPLIPEEIDVTGDPAVASHFDEMAPELNASKTDISDDGGRWAKAFDAEMRLWLDANRWKF